MALLHSKLICVGVPSLRLNPLVNLSKRRHQHARRQFSVQAMSGCPFISGGLGNLPTNEIDTPAPANWEPPLFSAPSSCTPAEYEQIARDLIDVAKECEGLPKLLRLGFHTCGSWSAAGRDAGPNGGWHQWPIDYNDKANAGLKNTILALKEYQRNHPKITHADLFTLAGCVAVEAAGGPPVAWYPGRRDALSPGPASPSYTHRLPPGDANAVGVLHFYTNMGLTVRETVALTGGGHSMGGADTGGSGFNGSFTSFDDAWPTPSNRYFRELVGLAWQYEVVPETQKLQWVLVPGQKDVQDTTAGGAQVMRLPSDMAFRTSTIFSYWAMAYARDVKAFEHDFQRAFQRIMQFGAGLTWTIDTSYKWKGLKGDWEGFGPDISPQLDTHDLPEGAPGNFNSPEFANFLESIAKPLADPSAVVPGVL